MTRNGILLPKLFWPTAIKNCSSDRKKTFEIQGSSKDFAEFLNSLEQLIQMLF